MFILLVPALFLKDKGNKATSSKFIRIRLTSRINHCRRQKKNINKNKEENNDANNRIIKIDICRVLLSIPAKSSVIQMNA